MKLCLEFRINNESTSDYKIAVPIINTITSKNVFSVLFQENLSLRYVKLFGSLPAAEMFPQLHSRKEKAE